jgi:hypothetical protein
VKQSQPTNRSFAQPPLNPFRAAPRVDKRHNLNVALVDFGEVDEEVEPLESDLAKHRIDALKTAWTLDCHFQEDGHALFEFRTQPRSLLLVISDSLSKLLPRLAPVADHFQPNLSRSSALTCSIGMESPGFRCASSARSRNSFRNAGVSTYSPMSISSQICRATRRRSSIDRARKCSKTSFAIMTSKYPATSQWQQCISCRTHRPWSEAGTSQAGVLTRSCERILQSNAFDLTGLDLRDAATGFRLPYGVNRRLNAAMPGDQNAVHQFSYDLVRHLPGFLDDLLQSQWHGRNLAYSAGFDNSEAEEKLTETLVRMILDERRMP